jgi:hypothetical protein
VVGAEAGPQADGGERDPEAEGQASGEEVEVEAEEEEEGIVIAEENALAQGLGELTLHEQEVLVAKKASAPGGKVSAEKIPTVVGETRMWMGQGAKMKSKVVKQTVIRKAFLLLG